MPGELTFAIFTASQNLNRSTHSYSFTVSTCPSPTAPFSRVRLKLINLDHSSHGGYSGLNVPSVSAAAAGAPADSAYAGVVQRQLAALLGPDGLSGDARAAEVAYRDTVAEIDRLAAASYEAQHEAVELELELARLREVTARGPAAPGQTFQLPDWWVRNPAELATARANSGGGVESGSSRDNAVAIPD